MINLYSFAIPELPVDDLKHNTGMPKLSTEIKYWDDNLCFSEICQATSVIVTLFIKWSELVGDVVIGIKRWFGNGMLYVK